jgi:hypothetical protein
MEVYDEVACGADVATCDGCKCLRWMSAVAMSMPVLCDDMVTFDFTLASIFSTIDIFDHVYDMEVCNAVAWCHCNNARWL